MLRFLADENLPGAMLAALLQRLPALDIVRVEDVGMGVDDPTVLEWCARDGRVLLTRDVRTMPDFAYQRVGRGLAMPGVFVIPQALPAAQVIEDLVLIAECSLPGEWEGQVRYLPLR